ncbi:MAG: OmpA family protein [Planctomycetaceae bacterium]
MSAMPRAGVWSLLVLLACGPMACTAVPPANHLRQSQLRAYGLYHKNQTLHAQLEQKDRLVGALAAQDQQHKQNLAALRNNLQLTERRLENLKSERSQMQERVVSLLDQVRGQGNPLSAETTKRFQELAEKYPNFEFDPHTGVSKFHSDILFNSGSAQLKPEAAQLLAEFADIMNAQDAQRLNILVVGHTDDVPIAHDGTRRLHPTNWHLSTNRANSVVLALAKQGIKEGRMAVGGHSMFMPLVENNDDSARKLNRRVEIYVLAPDAVVANWGTPELE